MITHQQTPLTTDAHIALGTNLIHRKKICYFMAGRFLKMCPISWKNWGEGYLKNLKGPTDPYFNVLYN